MYKQLWTLYEQREKQLATQRRSYCRDRDAYINRATEWRKNNPDRVKMHKLKSKEKDSETKKKWYQKNKNRLRLKAKAYMALKRGGKLAEQKYIINEIKRISNEKNEQV